jgi:nicotinate-nucleotide adenylyltransferase
VVGILGGTFDPPHNGHVALAHAAARELPIDELLIMVVAAPGHRSSTLDADARLRLVHAAFESLPGTRILREEHPYTVDALEAGGFDDPFFVVGADEGAAFLGWKEPERILELARLAVGTRSGYAPPDLARYGDRVVSFQLPSPPVSSSEVRRRLEADEPVDDLVPAAVAALIEREQLYGRKPGLH